MSSQTCPNWTSPHTVLGEQDKLLDFLMIGLIHPLSFCLADIYCLLGTYIAECYVYNRKFRESLLLE